MEIKNFVHKGLKELFVDDNPKGVPADKVDKLRKMLAFLQDMATVNELETIPFWDAHRLTGDRKGVWSLTVTRNWRMTFWIDQTQHQICDINLEDYH